MAFEKAGEKGVCPEEEEDCEDDVGKIVLENVESCLVGLGKDLEDGWSGRDCCC